MAVQADGSPPQAFSAGFELAGNARQGQLSLFTPLGGTLARLEWRPDAATMRTSDGQLQSFDSLDALMLRALGTRLPVGALFDWLAGVAVQAEGWQADLSRLPSGNLTARRVDPPPAAELRLVLDR